MNMKKFVAGVMACCIVGGIPSSFNITENNAVITASASEHTYEQLTYENCGSYIQITGCDESATEVVIPSEIAGVPVTTIYLGAFMDCLNLTSVEIPDSVTYIDETAFSGCINLKSINIPDSVTTIADYAFANCSSLEEIIISDSVKDIGEMAFYCCTNLKSIKIPDGVSTINKFTFGKCSSLAEIIIPDSVTYINSTAFSDTLWLEEKKKENPLVIVNNILIDGTTCEGDVVIPDGVTQICFDTFKNCLSLEEITIPDSVKKIENSAFEGCTNLKSVNIPDGVTEISSYAFRNCSSLEKIIIPDSVEEISTLAFANCKNLKSINLPDSLTMIRSSAFNNCTSLEEVIIPDSVTYIGENAFNSCTNLKSVILPDSIESLGDDAFKNTPWLEEKKKEGSLFIVNNILIDGTTCEGDVVIPDGVTKICNNAFSNCSSLEKITIPDSVKEIGDYAFENCTNLEEIILPDSVKKIGSYAFNNCENLKSVNIQGSFITIGRYAFSKCSSLEKIILPDSISIYDYAFFKCDNLRDVHYTGSVLNIFNTTGNDSLLSVIGDKLNFGDPLQYSYEIIPLFEPFQDYFYVKTDNLNPASFQFIDKESVYKNNSNIAIYKTAFSDVKYENLQTLRVSGGYIFKSDNTDGGIVTLQTKVNGEWNDTDVTLTLPTLYDDCDYLINTYAKKDNFFDNMDAVESGLNEICFYSGSFIRGEIVKEGKFWSMSSDGHIDQSLYIYSPYTRKDNKPLFASMVYPFRYDSLAFPSMMAIVSQRLDDSSAYYWDDSLHYLINVTYSGETRSYGGAGWIKGQGISEDKIKRFFTFDDNDEEITFENIKQLLVDYSRIEMNDDIPRDDELTWADICHTVNDGAWVKSSSTRYTYLYKLDDEELYSSSDYSVDGHKMYSGGSLGYTSDIWVDGRYISRYRAYIKGETFDKHPESDILLSHVTVPELKDYNSQRIYNSDTEKYEYVYSNIEIGETVKNVVAYVYDDTDKLWKASSIDRYDVIVDMAEKGQIDEKYLDMIQLTLDEVKALEVDRNTNIEPDHYYIYDGTVEPGTEFFAGTEEVTTTTTTSTTTTTIPTTTTTSTTTMTIPTTTTTSTTTTTIPTTTTTSTTTTTILTTTTTSTTITTNTTTSTTEPINQVVFGDVNDDGIVDANDASAVLAEYADFSTGGSGTFSDNQKLAGDINFDDIIDANDASAILAFYAYLSTGGTEKDMRVWLDM